MSYTTAYGLMRQQENGARHRGAVRSAESRERMRQAAIGRPMPRFDATPPAKIARAVSLVWRGEPQRSAARTAGVSLGALQRALRSLRA